MAAQVGSNSAPVDQAIKDACYEFGKREGDGALARQDYCDWICARAADGDVNVDGAAEYWEDFIRGSRARNHEIGGVREDTQTSQRIGDLKHYITLGMNKHIDGPELLAEARRVLAGMRDDGSATGTKTWDIMLVWLRKQNGSPERSLSEAEVRDLFRAQAKQQVDELARLTSVESILKKVVDDHAKQRTGRDEERARREAAGEDTDDLPEEDDDDDEDTGSALVRRALEDVQSRIAELGGTRKQQLAASRKAERERKAAEKQRAREARATP